jgi:hypothetical protein
MDQKHTTEAIVNAPTWSDNSIMWKTAKTNNG